MKRILCYGDSNTWGFTSIPCLEGGLPERFDENTRWTALLQKRLGEEYHVFEGGLGGRTTVFEDYTQGGRSGLEFLPVMFETCEPLDLVVIMLGTNDARDQFVHASDLIVRGMQRLVTELKKMISVSFNPACKILVVAPPKVIPNRPGPFSYKEEWAKVVSELPAKYEELCKMMDVHFASAYDWADPDLSDGLHLGPEGHAVFAEQIEKVIRSILE